MPKSKEGTVGMVPAGKLAAAQTKLWNELNDQGAFIVTQIDEIVIQIHEDENFWQPDYKLPLAIEETVKTFNYYRKTSISLNPQQYARCRDLSSSAGRVFVGGVFSADAFNINNDSNDYSDACVGCGAFRKYSI